MMSAIIQLLSLGDTSTSGVSLMSQMSSQKKVTSFLE